MTAAVNATGWKVRKLFEQYAGAREGSFMPLIALLMVPLALAVGMSVDYSAAVSSRSDMQNALDAATLSLTTLPKDTSDADRLTKLQDAYAANSGQGVASMVAAPVYDADGTLHLNTTASYRMPTNFMQLAAISAVPISVQTKVEKKPSLIQATFKIDKVSGWWNKTMTLYGTKFDETSAKKLMTITYAYNNGGDQKGYGTTTVYTVNGSTSTQVQQQVCTTVASSAYKGKTIPAGAIVDNANQKVTTCAMDPVSGGGATIDVSQMQDLYLQMDVTTGTKVTLKTNDPKTSDHLYLDGVEVEKGKTVDIFSVVPCGQPSSQAWEDGGSAIPAPVVNADFFYTVTGKCDFNKRVAETVITQ